MSQNENTRTITTVSGYHEDSESAQSEGLTNAEFFARLFSTTTSGWRDPALWPRPPRQQHYQPQHPRQQGSEPRNEARLMIEGKYFAILVLIGLEEEDASTAPEDEPDSRAVVLYRPRATSTIDDESAYAMPPPEVELRNRVPQSSDEGSQPTPRVCPRRIIRPTASSQYVGLSTANYFGHITTTTTATTATTTRTLKATSANSLQATASTASRQATSAASRQVATSYSSQQQTHTSSSSGRSSNDVRSSGVTPVQAPNSSSRRRRIEHSGLEETPQRRSAKGPASQLHSHITSEVAAARVEDHQHTVVDLMEYGLRYNLMDDSLFKVLYNRAAKELVRPEHIARFNILMEQFCDSHPSVYGDREFSEDESVLVRTPSQTAPAPTNRVQRQPQQPSRQPQPGQIAPPQLVQQIQRQRPRSQRLPPPSPSPRRNPVYDYHGRREETNQDHQDEPRIHKRTFDQLDLVSPGRVISMKRTRTEYQNQSNSSRR
ncbi:MAG: hypothetical protein J3Q66DRAFT_398182 [Benniella sp.]|nr:MAG: hypothetical protein J3Q66DRAFT_398182 [Benniella sp.]